MKVEYGCFMPESDRHIALGAGWSVEEMRQYVEFG